MASKKFSEFSAAGYWRDNWYLVGYDPGGLPEGSNKRIQYSAFTDAFALKATFDAHAADQTLHLSAAQNAGLDASSSPSGVNPYLTESAGDARYPNATTQASKDSAQDSAIASNTTHRTGAGDGASAHVSAGDRSGWNAKVESVVAGSNVSVDNSDPQNPVVSSTATGGSDLHADLTDLATSGHPGTVVTIAAGVQGNAVSIAADGSLQDSGVPPGGTGGSTDLSITTRTGINYTIASSSGQDAVAPSATNALAGLATAAQVTTLEATDPAGTARPPTAHTHTLADVTDAGTAAARDVPAAGDAGATECVLGNDSRLGGGGWVDDSVIKSWGNTEQALGTVSASRDVDLSLGHVITASVDTAAQTLNFVQNTVEHGATAWTVVLDGSTGIFPSFTYDSVAIELPDGYDISGTFSLLVISFTRTSLGVVMSERRLGMS